MNGDPGVKPDQGWTVEVEHRVSGSPDAVYSEAMERGLEIASQREEAAALRSQTATCLIGPKLSDRLFIQLCLRLRPVGHGVLLHAAPPASLS